MLGSEWKVIKGIFKPWHEDVVLYEDNSTDWRMTEGNHMVYRINGDNKGNPVYIWKDWIKTVDNKDVITWDDEYLYINDNRIIDYRVEEDRVQVNDDMIKNIMDAIKIKDVVIPFNLWKIITNSNEKKITFHNKDGVLYITDDCGMEIKINTGIDKDVVSYFNNEYLKKFKVYKGCEINVSFGQESPIDVNVGYKGMNWEYILAPYFI